MHLAGSIALRANSLHSEADVHASLGDLNGGSLTQSCNGDPGDGVDQNDWCRRDANASPNSGPVANVHYTLAWGAMNTAEWYDGEERHLKKDGKIWRT